MTIVRFLKTKIRFVPFSVHSACFRERLRVLRFLAVACFFAGIWFGVHNSVAAQPPEKFADAMERAHLIIKQTGDTKWAGGSGNLANFAGARNALEDALSLAETDQERALAYLAMARYKLDDCAWDDLRSIHEDCRMALTHAALPDTRALAAILEAEACLRENKYALARASLEEAEELAELAETQAKAQFTRARSLLQERRYADALVAYAQLSDTNVTPPLIVLEAAAHVAGIKQLPLLRVDRPRLFFNRDTWPAVKARAAGTEKKHLAALQNQLQELSDTEIERNDFGMRAMEAAFITRVTGSEADFDKTLRLLRATVDGWLHGAGDNRYYSRVAFAAALDWVWQDLAPADRLQLATGFINYAYSAIYTERKVHGLLHRPGYYYLSNTFWYAALASLDSELDDLTYARAVEMLGMGFKQNWELLGQSPAYALDDGGCGAFAVGRLIYEYAETPTPVWTFLHCMSSALGEFPPAAWVYLGITPHHVLRNLLSVTEHPGIKHFGFSNDWRRRGGYMRADLLYDHLAQFIHFYSASHPQEAGLARYLRERIAREGQPGAGTLSIFPFLLNLESAPPPAIPANLPLGRHFEGRGKVLMSSGFTSNDTYILFSCGGSSFVGGHRDAGHFSIYRKGFLALDTGTRAHSYGKTSDGPTFYFAQTIAHNCVLVRNPQRRVKWEDEMLAHTGGQDYGREQAQVLAFETTPRYVYAASDLTPTYNTNECVLNLRQFVFLPPNCMVVVDRVTAACPSYEKSWLLHTANEPEFKDKEFSAVQDQGKIFCRTILPLDANLEKIGGPGKEFWASGRNWGLTEESKYLRTLGMASADDVPEEQGRWRVEVRPGEQRETDYFVHLIETADRDQARMTSVLACESATNSNFIELSLKTTAGEYVMRFNKTGVAGGYLQIIDNGQVVRDSPLATRIMPQAGMALTGEPAWHSEYKRALEEEQLWSPNPLETLRDQPQAEAAVMLAGASAIPELIAALDAPSPQIQACAAWGLGQLAAPNATEKLLTLALTKTGRVSAVAIAALGQIASQTNSRAITALTTLLTDPDPELRSQAATALGGVSDQQGKELLIRTLQTDAEPIVRAAAAAALGGQPTSERSVLEEALEDEDWRVRRQAGAALAEAE